MGERPLLNISSSISVVNWVDSNLDIDTILCLLRLCRPIIVSIDTIMDACTTARPKHSKRRTANANIVCIASVHDERFLLHRRRRRFIMNADTYAEADPTTPTHPRRRKRCRPMGGGAGAIFLLSIVTKIGPLSRSGVYATKNFCGLTWGDASADCQNSQPCPLGTDEECTSGGTFILEHGRICVCDHRIFFCVA